jgi:hypothetical protein
MSVLQQLYAAIQLPVPRALAGWTEKVSHWGEQYRTQWPGADLKEMCFPAAVFVFDRYHRRVCLAFGVCAPQLLERPRVNRLPNMNSAVRDALGDEAYPADPGHFLGNVSGGRLDINIFPQRRDLNRGWTQDGKRFRQMEHFVKTHPGTFFYHHAFYIDETWIPDRLEYGVLREDGTWWIESFGNARPWLAGCFAASWFKDAVSEASRSSDSGARRREILFAVTAAESFLVEWVRDDVLRRFQDLDTYLPPGERRPITLKWKEIPKHLEAAGLIKSSPKLNGSTWADFRVLVEYRNGLVHARASRPAMAGLNQEQLPVPTMSQLETLAPGWAVRVVTKLIVDLCSAAGTAAPTWVLR